MRHNRSAAFELAWAEAPSSATTWHDHARDPNDPAAVAHRAKRLAAAWRPPINDRIAFLESRVRDKSVLDIGCVAHDSARMASPDWLHGRLAAAAKTCIGVDILEAGVAAMVGQGYRAVVHDLSTGLGRLAADAPFDVVVAGELFEHVADLDMVFRVASEALTDDGQMILTTPNPYAPSRVRAGQRGIVWENADHIMYAFPSGMAELAERHGLVLSEATTIRDATPTAGPMRRLRQWLRGSGWRNVGFGTASPAGPVAVDGRPTERLGERLASRLRPADPRFTGETFVYIITRPSS